MFRTTFASRAAILAGACATLAAAVVHADPSPALDRVSVSAGVFDAQPKIYAEGDTQYGHVRTPDAEGSRTTLPRFRADVLIGDSQGISFDYFRYDKDYDANLSGATTYQGRPIVGTATLHTNLRLELAQLAYRWWIGRENDVFGIGVGGAYLRARAEGNVNGQVSAQINSALPVQTMNFSGNGSTGDSAYAPLLELGWRHAFTPDLRLYAEAAGVKKNGGRVDGHVYNGAVGVEWFPARNVGVVVDYGIQKISLERNGDRSADLNVRLTGPSAYVKLRF